jgi:surface polysaccharide O-acyltransferase-like enzyme
MNKYLSDKLRVISFISMIMVVFVHSYHLKLQLGEVAFRLDAGFNIFIQQFISQGIARVAVPIFFIISGYLFFLNFQGTKSEFILKYKKRAKSLLVPFLFWSILGLIIHITLRLSPLSKNLVSDVDYSFIRVLDLIFINPIPAQLWFLRDLIVLVAFSPLIYRLVKHLRFIPIILFFIIWLVAFRFRLVLYTSESVLFFSLGAYLALHKSEYLTKQFIQKYNLIFLFLWVLIVIVKTILLCQNYSATGPLLILHRLGIVVGILAVWSLYDVIMKNKESVNKTLLTLSSFSFFVFLFHMPLLKYAQKALFYIAGKNEIVSIVSYFILPIIIIAIGILLGGVLRRYTPKFYGLITGGR